MVLLFVLLRFSSISWERDESEKRATWKERAFTRVHVVIKHNNGDSA